MTAEEQQDQALDAVIAAKTQQRSDRKAAAAAKSVLDAKQAARDKSYAAYLAAEKERTQALEDYFNANNKAETEDVVAIAKASQAYAEAMQNHGLILT